MKYLITPAGRQSLLALSLLSGFGLLGAIPAQAHDDDRDGFRDGGGHYHRYGYHHHHRGYWDERNGTRLFINVG
jgi:hypothetical protein